MACYFVAQLALAVSALSKDTDQPPPHIVMVIVDDLGYADVGYHGSRIPTPNIDSLSKEGIRLENYFAHPICTPSRAALFTGRYAHTNGLTGIHTGPNPYGLTFPTLAEELRDSGRGYRRHYVGKWHLGHSRWSHTPTGKGWESFLGLYNGGHGHYSKVLSGPLGVKEAFYDWVRSYDNGTFSPVIDETHSTIAMTLEAMSIIDHHQKDNGDAPLFLVVSYTAPHTPLLAEPEWIAKCAHLPNPVRRDYCGLVVGLDEALGQLADHTRTVLGDNVLFIFTSDNGGMPHVGGLNTPLRGGKNTGWQGGSRVVGWVADWTPTGMWLGTGRGVWNGLMHIADWMPTILSIVNRTGLTHPTNTTSAASGVPPFDGLDISSALQLNTTSPRTEVMLTMDEFTNMIAFQTSEWKIMLGHFGDGWWSTESDSSWWARVPGDWWEKFYEVVVWVLEPFSCRDILFFWQEVVHVMVHTLKAKWEGKVDLYNRPSNKTAKPWLEAPTSPNVEKAKQIEQDSLATVDIGPIFGRSIVDTVIAHFAETSKNLPPCLASSSGCNHEKQNALVALLREAEQRQVPWPFPVALFRIDTDPSETKDLAASQPKELARMLQLVDKYWIARPPGRDWREACGPLPMHFVDPKVCNVRRSHLFPEPYRRSTNPQ